MAGINKAIILGHLGRDPELKHTQSGSAVCNFSVATSESWTDKQTGQKQERTEWHRIVAFSRLAEICGQYLLKGSQVYIEGRIQTREWTDRDGNRRFTTEIVADKMQMLGGRQEGGNNGGRPDTRNAGKPGYDAHGQETGGPDIPF